MNGLALTFLGAATWKPSCAFWRPATIASVTPTLTTAAMIRHKSASTLRSEERPAMLKGVQDPLGRVTPLHLLTRLLGHILEPVE